MPTSKNIRVRIRLGAVSLLLGVLSAGCDAATSTEPDATSGYGTSSVVEAGDASCTLAVHAILREAGSAVTVGQVQFRVDPPTSGSGDATVQYRGTFGPTDGLSHEVLSVGLLSRIPGQGPSWTDVDKNDPGNTLSSVLEFGRTASMSGDMALALVDDPSRFKAVVNVVGTTGGREAEGTVEPRTEVPESLRERQRLCFAAD
ncbi:MAG TPA: hypothetical protein VLA09_03950 [Longimicrobiales bacterium]|nr:hypothetical protein [Longimicrobiales bacterium]